MLPTMIDDLFGSMDDPERRQFWQETFDRRKSISEETKEFQLEKNQFDEQWLEEWHQPGQLIEIDLND